MMLSKFEIIINFLSSTTLNLNYVFQFKDALLNEVYNAKDFHKKASEDKKLLCLPLFKAIGMENPEAYYGFNPDGYLLQNILDEVTSISFSFEM